MASQGHLCRYMLHPQVEPRFRICLIGSVRGSTVRLVNFIGTNRQMLLMGHQMGYFRGGVHQVETRQWLWVIQTLSVKVILGSRPNSDQSMRSDLSWTWVILGS